MPTATVDGIETLYEVTGSGPPLLMLSPGGFNAAMGNWESLSIYRRLRLVPHLSERFSCITFDRREAGSSGGRVQTIRWDDYAAQGKGLLDHLGIERAHLMGGCVGCSVALTFATRYPASASSLVLFSPAGGAQYRIKQQARFHQHLAFVEDRGLEAVVALAGEGTDTFSSDARVGPWASVLRRDSSFAASYQKLDAARYAVMVAGMARVLFDRDTVSGAEPEELMGIDIPAFVVPGHDSSHATSAARYLEECLPRSRYWDIAVEDQTEDNVPGRILEFLSGAGS